MEITDGMSHASSPVEATKRKTRQTNIQQTLRVRARNKKKVLKWRELQNQKTNNEHLEKSKIERRKKKHQKKALQKALIEAQKRRELRDKRFSESSEREPQRKITSSNCNRKMIGLFQKRDSEKIRRLLDKKKQCASLTRRQDFISCLKVTKCFDENKILPLSDRLFQKRAEIKEDINKENQAGYDFWNKHRLQKNIALEKVFPRSIPSWRRMT
eukprot:snap_masked-scaffold_2-processed-gene-18.24-mRNA-1 protein AED:1.00 eAED:1.00 QI:0/0/0/0/1/1/2/0/213